MQWCNYSIVLVLLNEHEIMYGDWHFHTRVQPFYSADYVHFIRHNSM